MAAAVDRWTELAAKPEAADLADQVFELVYTQMRAIAAARHQELDDLVQIAAEQAFRALPSFEGRSQLSTWTYRICYHALVSHERWSSRFFRRFIVGREAPEWDDPTPHDEPSKEDRKSTRLNSSQIGRASCRERV